MLLFSDGKKALIIPHRMTTKPLESKTMLRAFRKHGTNIDGTPYNRYLNVYLTIILSSIAMIDETNGI